MLSDAEAIDETQRLALLRWATGYNAMPKGGIKDQAADPSPSPSPSPNPNPNPNPNPTPNPTPTPTPNLTLTLIKAAGLIKLLPYPDAGEATLPEVHTCTRDMHLPPYAHRHQVADRLYKLLEHSDGGFNKE